jgi:hypothetical protein
MLEIREFDPLRDRQAVRACFVELQEFERKLDPRMPPGERVADTYLELMFQRCREFEGVILVAEVDRAVAGFVTIWTRYRSFEPDDDPAEHGFISNLIVSATHRDRGIGRSLLLHGIPHETRTPSASHGRPGTPYLRCDLRFRVRAQEPPSLQGCRTAPADLHRDPGTQWGSAVQVWRSKRGGTPWPRPIPRRILSPTSPR